MRKAILASFVVVLTLTPAAEARRRAARHPAPPCAYSLAPTWTGPIPAAGVTRAAILLFGQSQECSTWAAYSSEDWALVEAAPADAQPAAYVTISANPQTTPRTATITVAGIGITVTQEAASSTVAPPQSAGNLVVNGTFDTGIAPWGWQDRFPNGRGVAQWSQFDAGGNPQSGSILLRDDEVVNPGFQQLQCIRVSAGTRHRYGAKVRATTNSGSGLMAVFSYDSPTCAGQYRSEAYETFRIAELGVWQEVSWRMRTGASTQAVLVVIVSAAESAPFELWFDDVFLRPE